MGLFWVGNILYVSVQGFVRDVWFLVWFLVCTIFRTGLIFTTSVAIFLT